ncbi:hypothetical protein [Facklamia miroungae]|uniref:SdpI/YhfL protein family protein n=1 Tax=Facklamia miroungae TaxID=120956 RepID=A0A1G7PYF6_9LACT|nr:hypothetical protein [Facklamia miroungae]NKZ28848.1 hypothetical protein [Facklamia miroungae]SDF90400.1 hypothetical protein SAMN05421791_101393 [Facklamia miroungae]
MKKLSYRTKFFTVLAIIFILSLVADFYDLLEVNRYNVSMVVLLLSTLIYASQSHAAIKSVETMLSVSLDYQQRKWWNIEDQYDWEKVRMNKKKWAPIGVGISLIQIVIFLLAGERYFLFQLIIWIMTALTYAHFIRPVKLK